VKKTNMVVVQPNSDPYNVKFSTSYATQFYTMLQQVRGKITDQTDYLVLPETFITGFSNDLNEDELNQLPEVQAFRDSLLRYYPRLRILTGANTFHYYAATEDHGTTARLDNRMGLYYDFYNTALYITAAEAAVYHKSKLVPGVEKMPFPWLMKPLESFAIDLGGTVGSLGTQDQRTVFTDAATGVGIAPVICYESVYGDFMTEYIRKGAGIICIITNDGWWGDTPGYRQHLAYARLRAIESRRPVVRCANTGISCFISAQGEVTQATPYWEPAVIHGAVAPGNKQTFFVLYGDVIAYTSVLISLLLIISGIILNFRRKMRSAEH
jgi:apolipoprotein N-acyltransferase